jgi:hypothetical protein
LPSRPQRRYSLEKLWEGINIVTGEIEGDVVGPFVLKLKFNFPISGGDSNDW